MYIFVAQQRSDHVTVLDWEDHKLHAYAAEQYDANTDRIADILKSMKCNRLLDIGCGGGELLEALMREGVATVACGVDVQVKTLGQVPKFIHAVRADAQWLPFREAVFDLVVSNQVLEHVLSADRFLDEACHVLQKSGTLVLSTPNLCSLHNRLLVLAGYQPTCLHVSEVQVGNPLLLPSDNQVRLTHYAKMGQDERMVGSERWTSRNICSRANA